MLTWLDAVEAYFKTKAGSSSICASPRSLLKLAPCPGTHPGELRRAREERAGELLATDPAQRFRKVSSSRVQALWTLNVFFEDAVPWFDAVEAYFKASDSNICLPVGKLLAIASLPPLPASTGNTEQQLGYAGKLLEMDPKQRFHRVDKRIRNGGVGGWTLDALVKDATPWLGAVEAYLKASDSNNTSWPIEGLVALVRPYPGTSPGRAEMLLAMDPTKRFQISRDGHASWTLVPSAAGQLVQEQDAHLPRDPDCHPPHPAG